MAACERLLRCPSAVETFGREVSSLESRQERFGSASASQPAGASERRQEHYMSKQSFAELGVSSAVRAALTRRGITAPFPIQRLVLEDALAGRDVLVKSPTGSGKTLAFGIPLAERLDRSDATPAALVLAPTRELARQILGQVDDLVCAKGLRSTAVYGGVGLTPQAKRAPRAHVLVATPGRLEDLLGRGAVTLD